MRAAELVVDPAADAVVAVGDEARAVDPAVGHARERAGDRGRDLVGRPRGEAGDAAVEVGRGAVLVVGLLAGAADARDEVVGVVAGHRGHGDDRPGVGLDHHRGGAAGPADDGFHQRLPAGVDRQLDARAGAGPAVVDHANHPALFILEDPLDALRAAQVVVHRRLDAHVPLVVAEVVVEAGAGALGDVALFPLLDVAEDVGGERAERVFAHRAQADLDAGQVEVVLGEAGELVVGQVAAVAEGDQPAVGEEVDAERARAVVLGQAVLLERPDDELVEDRDDVGLVVGAGHAVLGDQGLDHRLLLVLAQPLLVDLLEVEAHLVGRAVAGEHHAVAVGDLPAHAGLAHRDRARAGDQPAELVAARDLEVVQPDEQHAAAADHDRREQVEPGAVGGVHRFSAAWGGGPARRAAGGR